MTLKGETNTKLDTKVDNAASKEASDDRDAAVKSANDMVSSSHLIADALRRKADEVMTVETKSSGSSDDSDTPEEDQTRSEETAGEVRARWANFVRGRRRLHAGLAAISSKMSELRHHVTSLTGPSLPLSGSFCALARGGPILFTLTVDHHFHVDV